VCRKASACCWKGSRIWTFYRGLPAPTQQHFESEAIAILRVAAGRVVEIRGTADRLGMLTQLGIQPDIG
jgi:ketosteroid isomerase-like protein